MIELKGFIHAYTTSQHQRQYSTLDIMLEEKINISRRIAQQSPTQSQT